MAEISEYIAFVDLVGVKDAHAGNPFVYADKIQDFQVTLVAHINALEKNQRPERDCQVFVFSDCAFIRSARVGNIINYLRWVRHACYTGANILFFKGAIVKGSLIATESQGKNTTLKGVTFSPDAVKAYVRHELSKAIGIVVDPDVAREMQKSDCVTNYYYSSERSRSANVFIDLAHSPELDAKVTQKQIRRSPIVYQGISIDIVRHCRNEFYRATMRSLKLARYYPPIFCNWIQSVDLKAFFSGTRFALTSEELANESDNSPWSVYELICSKQFVKHFWNVPGVPILYFVILNKIYSAFVPPRSCSYKLPTAVEEIHKFILGIKNLNKVLDQTPPQLLTGQCREAYLNSLVDNLQNQKPTQ